MFNIGDKIKLNKDFSDNVYASMWEDILASGQLQFLDLVENPDEEYEIKNTNHISADCVIYTFQNNSGINLKIALTLDGKWYGAENMFSSEVFILAKESKDNSFCHCDNPRLVTRKVLFNTYQYCLICRKEKI